MIKRILVGLGGTPFTEVALRRAVELARSHDATLTGVTVVDTDRIQKVGPVPAGGGAYAQRMAKRRIAVTRERVDQAVSAYEQACAETGAHCTVEKEAGDPFDLMISYARYHDLTIFGLRSLFDYGIAPEPKDAVIRLLSQGVRPILAVSPQFRTIRKAMVAYSGSMESAKAMRRFVQMRLWPGIQIEIVTVDRSAAEGKRLLGDAADYCRAHGHAPETVLLEGNAETQVLAHAKASGADIIVMGNSARSLMFRQILGGTALHTIRNADRPIFLAQ
jgi:nucleotide-binding universal stress UspA family protein